MKFSAKGQHHPNNSREVPLDWLPTNLHEEIPEMDLITHPGVHPSSNAGSSVFQYHYSMPERPDELSCNLSTFDMPLETIQSFLQRPQRLRHDSYSGRMMNIPPSLSHDEIESILMDPVDENIRHNYYHDSMNNYNPSQYTFVQENPGVKKKRQRRCPSEIERNYYCTWPSCNKAYGTLSHLNTHIKLQGHGPIKTSSDFVRNS
jgi:hypothetical protein